MRYFNFWLCRKADLFTTRRRLAKGQGGRLHPAIGGTSKAPVGWWNGECLLRRLGTVPPAPPSGACRLCHGSPRSPWWVRIRPNVSGKTSPCLRRRLAARELRQKRKAAEEQLIAECATLKANAEKQEREKSVAWRKLLKLREDASYLRSLVANQQSTVALLEYLQRAPFFQVCIDLLTDRSIDWLIGGFVDWAID